MHPGSSRLMTDCNPPWTETANNDIVKNVQACNSSELLDVNLPSFNATANRNEQIFEINAQSCGNFATAFFLSKLASLPGAISLRHGQTSGSLSTSARPTSKDVQGCANCFATFCR